MIHESNMIDFKENIDSFINMIKVSSKFQLYYFRNSISPSARKSNMEIEFVATAVAFLVNRKEKKVVFKTLFFVSSLVCSGVPLTEEN